VRSVGNAGNAIPFNMQDRRRGADPPKNVSGRINDDFAERANFVSAGSGACIKAEIFCNLDLDIPEKLISTI